MSGWTPLDEKDGLFKRIDQVNLQIADADAQARVLFTRMEQRKLKARLKRGKYKGRLGRIDGFLLDQQRGLLLCVYVLRLTRGKYKLPTEAVLNSDGESRQYWPIDDLELVE